MAKTYSSIDSMLEDVGIDKKFIQDFKERSDKRVVARLLFSMRTGAGKTQAQMAKDLHTTQGSISKLESAEHDAVTFADFFDYLQHTNHTAKILVSQGSPTIVDEVKYHACQLKDHLDELARLANENDDEKLREGIHEFFSDAFMNLIAIITTSRSTLPKLKFKKGKRAFPFEIKEIEISSDKKNQCIKC